MKHKYIFTDKTSSQIIDAKQFEMIDYGKNLSRSRLSEQNLRVDEWSVCRG
jgi:hypothetical protein